MRPLFILLLACLICITSCGDTLVFPESPDGKIRLTLGSSADQAFTYSVYYDGQLMVRPSSIRLEFQDQEDFGEALDLEFISESFFDENWKPLWGKTSEIRNRYTGT